MRATADDGNGNVGFAVFTVTVVDTTGPSVVCSNIGPLEGNTLGGFQGDAAYNCTASDIVAGDVSASLSFDILASSLFGLGATTVEATASDGNGNSGSTNFTVTVVDTTGPTVLCSNIGPLEGNTLGGFQGNAGYGCAASDIVAGDVSASLSFDILATSLFGLGATTVEATASDGNGNSGSANFTVTVVDTTGPSVVCSNVGPLEGNSLGGFHGDAGYNCTASDIVAGDVSASLSFDILATSLFGLGATTVEATASDGNGNSGGTNFTVTVVDTTGPSVVCSNIGPLEGNTLGGFHGDAGYACSANDIVAGDVSASLSFDILATSLFGLGATTVEATASDGNGNSGSANFTVTVVDTTDPTVACSDIGPLEGNTLGGFQGDAGYACSASDIVAGDVSASLSFDILATGLFGVGATTVQATAFDGNGNSEFAYFTVTVVDTTEPVVTVPANMTLGATNSSGAVANFAASAQDIVDGSIAPTCSPPSGSTFPIGVTTVTCSATDASNNTGTASFTVTVENTVQVPTVALSGPAAALEGETKTYTFEVSDDAQDSFTVSNVSCGANGSLVSGSLAVTAAGGSFACSFPEGPAISVVSVQVTDSGGQSSNSDEVSVTVNNVAPVITGTISGPTSAVPGQPLAYSVAGFTDAGTTDTHATAWQVLSSGNAVVASGSGLTLAFTPTAVGTYTVRFTVTDDDLGSDFEEAPLSVSYAGTQTGACGSNTGTALVVGGMAVNDRIHVNPIGNTGTLQVSITNRTNGVQEFQQSFVPSVGGFRQIVIIGQAADDYIQIAESIAVPACIHAGAGNDNIKGGSGDDILEGGAGDDLILGGNGRDIMIGGFGADRLVGNPGEDILIAGRTLYDQNDSALSAIRREWTSGASYNTRVAHLRGCPGGLNGGYFLRGRDEFGGLGNQTVFDDYSVDRLTGSQGIDWFLASLNPCDDYVLDIITDWQCYEQASDIDFNWL